MFDGATFKGAVLSRTVWFNVLAAAVYAFLEGIQSSVSPELYAGAVAIINVVLRAVTTESLTAKAGG